MSTTASENTLKAFMLITNNLDEVQIRLMIDEVIPEYVNDIEDEFIDVFEAYMEQGCGEAEAQIIWSTIKNLRSQIILSGDEQVNLFGMLKEEWGV